MRAFQFFACTSQCFRWSGRCVPLSFCKTCGLTGVSTCRKRCCRWRFDGSAAVPRARSCPSQSLNLPQEGVQLLLRCRHPLVGTVRPQQLLRFAALAQNPLDSVKITFSHPKHSLRLLPDGIAAFSSRLTAGSGVGLGFALTTRTAFCLSGCLVSSLLPESTRNRSCVGQDFRLYLLFFASRCRSYRFSLLFLFSAAGWSSTFLSSGVFLFLFPAAGGSSTFLSSGNPPCSCLRPVTFFFWTMLRSL